ncbi:ArnT family glycosyltransferase [Pseudomonas sp. FW305-70]|uniref:ArnT family glycosyltransferase n=1 Tax=Pseudomonas sp. FW305-70 TaxID=2751342 RepID=UPI000F94B650|nr:hypothetical protein [Pseudomonas sp. FW305-70]
MRGSLSTRNITLLVAIAIALLFFWGLGSVPFLSVNEARRAVTVREMREAGSWLLPYMNGDLYLSKPPFFYWTGLAIHLPARPGLVESAQLRAAGLCTADQRACLSVVGDGADPGLCLDLP